VISIQAKAAYENISKYRGVVTLVLLLSAFLFAFNGNAFAATVHVSSDPIARGSVTPGYNDLVLQALTMRTDSETAQFTAISINEFGTGDATATVRALRFFKETNTLGGLQIGSDSTVTVSTNVFSADTTNFLLSSPEIIDTTNTTFYIVYSIETDTPYDVSIGSNLINQNSITLSAGNTVTNFTNLSSREIMIVATPHATDIEPTPFSEQTNLCQTCHSVHIAPDFRESYGFSSTSVNKFTLSQPYFEAPSAINTSSSDSYNALCLNCHDGTGSATDIKSKYNSVAVDYPGHLTANDGTQTVGFKPPPSGESYNANLKMPCLICHDLHGSELGNYKIMSDSLYTYSVSSGWTDTDGRIGFGDEPCLVCHIRAGDNTRSTTVMGISMDALPITCEETTTANCINAGCHNDPHELN
jgi:hypothetical protein